MFDSYKVLGKETNIKENNFLIRGFAIKNKMKYKLKTSAFFSYLIFIYKSYNKLNELNVLCKNKLLSLKFFFFFAFSFLQFFLSIFFSLHFPSKFRGNKHDLNFLFLNLSLHIIDDLFCKVLQIFSS